MPSSPGYTFFLEEKIKKNRISKTLDFTEGYKGTTGVQL